MNHEEALVISKSLGSPTLQISRLMGKVQAMSDIESHIGKDMPRTVEMTGLLSPEQKDWLVAWEGRVGTEMAKLRDALCMLYGEMNDFTKQLR